MRFKEGQLIIMHSLGETTPGEYKGTIRGVSGDLGDDPATIYIVELDAQSHFRGNYPYSCITMPQACIREI